ncbi:MAG: hypothetical protein Q4P06_02170 [Actinomycetaceae bacterium]|nr:hypothetical protein [Actinomycetaceae bacterium]
MSQADPWWEADIYQLTQWASQYPHLWQNIADHPNCSAELKQWIQQQTNSAGSQVPVSYEAATGQAPANQAAVPNQAPATHQAMPGQAPASHVAVPNQAPATHPAQTPGNHQPPPARGNSTQKRKIVLIIVICLLALAATLTGLAWKQQWWQQTEPTPTTQPTSTPTPTPTTEPTPTPTPTPTPNHPAGWDDIKNHDFQNATWEMAWVFFPDETRATNINFVNGIGQGKYSTLRVVGPPVYADANSDGYLDAYVSLESKSPNRSAETRSYIFTWNPQTKQPQQIHWYVAEQGDCLGTLTSVEPDERGFTIKGTKPAYGAGCSQTRNIPYTRTIAVDGKYPIRVDKPGWGGMCAADPATNTNLLSSGQPIETVQLAPEDGAPPITNYLPENQNVGVYVAAWHDGEIIYIDGYKQVIIQQPGQPLTGDGDYGCAFIPE